MTTEKKPRGFAVLKLKDAEKLKAIAQAGGKAAHAKGAAHEWTIEEAKAAGKKGGSTTAARRITSNTAALSMQAPNAEELEECGTISKKG